MPSVLQPWVHDLTFMQQSVLLTAVRGPDGLPKYDPPKKLLRFFRRSFLISALDNEILNDPIDPRGGSFTGPSVTMGLQGGCGAPIEYGSEEAQQYVDNWETWIEAEVASYIRHLDAIPHHFQTHFMHAVHIVGVYHPDERIRAFWKKVYLRLVNEMHLYPEPDEAMAKRLGDVREDWLARSDPATTN